MAAKDLMNLGVGKVIITLGSEGCLLVEGSSEVPTICHIPGKKVAVVDTVGAGDSFLGSLGFFLSKGFELTSALDKANVVASVSVQSKGTQSSYPRKEQLPQELFQ